MSDSDTKQSETGTSAATLGANAGYDVVIVGGGSAGAVLARRLSENKERRVLLLEAGDAYGPWAYPNEVASSDSVGDMTGVDWGFVTEPGWIGRPLGAFRGKILGGSSAMNGAVAIRARPQDLKNWNLPGWSFEDLLPAFRRLEESTAADDSARGHEGPLPARQMTRSDITPMQNAFMDAAIATGFAVIDDFDGPDVNGVGPYSMNIANGVRMNTGMTYLSNAVRARANLEIRSGALVDRVTFDGTRATGVLLANGEAIAAGEVILSAGTYGSPAILLRSGVGPRDDLVALGVEVVSDLPVGMFLKDHPFYFNAYAAKSDRIGRQSPVIGAKLWTHSASAENGDEDLHITATHLFPHDQSPTGVGFVLAVALTRPASIGRLWIDSLDPLAPPRIDLAFLEEPKDRERMIEGIRLARRIGRTAPLADLIEMELVPGAEADSDEAILASMKTALDTYHHPTSTCRMGADEDRNSVVGLDARVRGTTGLSVIDASIFPDAISVATNVTTIAVAEHLAAGRT
jgi:choline dehydrogenase